MKFPFPYVNGKYTAYEDKVDPKKEKKVFLSVAVKLIDDYTSKNPIGSIKVKLKENDKKIIKNLSGYYLLTNLNTGKYTAMIDTDYYFSKPEVVIDIDLYRDRTAGIKLGFDSHGPVEGGKSIKLKNVSRLQNDDIIEFRNSKNNIEQREIVSIDRENHTIAWNEGLKYKYDTAGSTVNILKYILLKIPLKPRPAYPFSEYATLFRGKVVSPKDNNDPVAYATVTVKKEEIQEEKDLITETDEGGEFVLYFKKIKEEKEINIRIEKNGASKKITPRIQVYETVIEKEITLLK